LLLESLHSIAVHTETPLQFFIDSIPCPRFAYRNHLSMSIQSLAHVCLLSADLDATSKFYCGALGMEKQFDFTRKGRVIGFYLKASERTFIEVFESEKARDAKPAGNITHFCLETDDIEKLYQEVAAAGYQPRPIKLGCDKSYQFWVTDPNGVELEFHQYTPQSGQLTPGNVEVDW